MNLEVLAEYGIDYQKGLGRCLDDEEFYESLLALFLEDDAFTRAQAAFERKDYATLFKCMHELKGACGNVDMTELYQAVCALVELVRDTPGPEDEIAAHFAQVEAAYRRARKGVELAIGGSGSPSKESAF